jgi:hypothetical protein
MRNRGYYIHTVFTPYTVDNALKNVYVIVVKENVDMGLFAQAVPEGFIKYFLETVERKND